MKGLWQDKTFRLKKCKPYIMVFCMLFAMMQLLGSTLAWFTAADSRVNSMETPPDKFYSIHVVDVFNPQKDDGFYHKRVGAANGAEKPGLVRLVVLATLQIPSTVQGMPPTLLPVTFGGPGSGALVIMSDFNSADWIDATDPSAGGDGYFYYKHILEPGETTDTGYETHADHNLFNRVKVAGSLPPGYENAQLVIEVKCEAVGISPPDTYIGSWWNGVIPASGSTLYTVHTALQQALG